MRGVDVILKTQIKVKGSLTAWCAQHDEVTLEPAMARKYELVSLSGSESVGIVEFLMEMSHPPPGVIDAIQGAVAWFNHSRVEGIEVKTDSAQATPRGAGRIVVANSSAPSQWARFYEIVSNRPIVSGRDSAKRYSMAEIEYERRNGYRWYTDRPAKLLDVMYPAWRKRWSVSVDARGR